MSVDQHIEPTIDEAILRRWIGRKRIADDRIDCRHANLVKATLDPDRPDYAAGDVLPGGWHWAWFLTAPRIDRLGRDGHEALGTFLPPVALPRRMWAGTRLKFHGPIRLEEKLRKVSRVVDVTRKTGRSGELCFVTVNHRYYCGPDIRLEEDHDIVYRGGESGTVSNHPERAEVDADRSMVITPSTSLLFRYSALTFNGHRIHYDIDFCRDVEGYPGLVVHAPLLATLMLSLAERHFSGKELRMREFRQRSVSPLFHDQPFTIHLRENDPGCRIWAANHEGLLAATAELSLI